MSNHLACLRGCGLVVAVPEGRRSRYELTDERIGHALDDLISLVLVVDPDCSGGEAQSAPTVTSKTAHRHDRLRGPSPSPPNGTGGADPLVRGRDDRLQRDRGRRGTHRGGDRVLQCTDRFRSGLRDRGGVGGRGRLAVLRIATPKRGRRWHCRCIAFSFFALAAFVTVTRAPIAVGRRRSRPLHRRSDPGRGLPRGDAGAVLRPASRRPRARLPLGGRRLQADPALHVPVCGVAPRTRSQRLFGWTWADPIAALVIAGIAVREGVAAWRGDACCTTTSGLADQLVDGGCSCAGGCSEPCCGGLPEVDTKRARPS